MKALFRFKFQAAHRLPKLKGSKCEELHGHEYRVLVIIEHDYDRETGMTIEFTEFREKLRREIVEKLDHKYLNDLIENPTAENIALWIKDKVKKLAPAAKSIRVRVWETLSAGAEA